MQKLSEHPLFVILGAVGAVAGIVVFLRSRGGTGAETATEIPASVPPSGAVQSALLQDVVGLQIARMNNSTALEVARINSTTNLSNQNAQLQNANLQYNLGQGAAPAWANYVESAVVRGIA